MLQVYCTIGGIVFIATLIVVIGILLVIRWLFGGSSGYNPRM